MAETLIVQTTNGPVRGRRECGTKNVVYYNFQGIPYAKSPVGELRFKAPQRPKPWTDVLDCTELGPVSLEITPEVLKKITPLPNRKTEDCLCVNVYKKVSEVDRKVLPVVVMIHGGGFSFTFGGDGFFKPDFMLEHDILYVHVTYRLGAFGFLSIADPAFDIPGNAGLKDQVLALRWVQENCTHFGGDVNNITIMGLSAGGASVHYHLISDHSEGLFHRAIVQSGSAFSPWASQPPQRNVNERLARALGWTGDGGDEAMWRTIVDAPTSEIDKQQNALVTTMQDIQNGLISLFVPLVEPYDNGTIFIDRPLAEMNASAWGHRIPLLIGGLSGDGYLVHLDFVRGSEETIFELSGFENALPLDLKLDDAKRHRLGEALRRLYYDDGETPSTKHIKPYMDLMTDQLFWHPIYRILQARFANPAGNSAPTYLYHFDFSSEAMSVLQTLLFGKHVPDRMSHADDSLYQYRIPALHDALPVDCWEMHLQQIYTSLLMNFAASGKPTHPEIDELNWQPLDGPRSGPLKCLNIAKELSVIDLPVWERLQFWESLYKL